VLRWILLLGLLLAAAASMAGNRSVAAADWVDPALLAGPGFRVAPRAEPRGLQLHFRIQTDWGELDAPSVEMLGVRVGEMAALQALYSHEVTAALKTAGIDQLNAPVSAAKALASDPVGSAKRLPQGILRYFTERVRRWGDRARKIGDRVERSLSHSGTPYDADGPMTHTPEAEAEPWWDKPVDEVGRLLRSQAGHGRARRELARQFGVDSWTSNPLLRARLDALAWAVASERLAWDYALKLAAPVVAEAVGHLQRAHSLSGEPEPTELRRILEQRLEHWTADDDLRYALAWRGGFPPMLLAELLDQLDALAPTAGAEALLEVALMADNEVEARFVLNSLRMLQSRPGGRFLPIASLIGYVDIQGEFWLPLPVDQLTWSATIRHWFEHAQITRHARRNVLVGGAISPAAQRALTRRGWSLFEFHRYPGEPPYRRGDLPR